MSENKPPLPMKAVRKPRGRDLTSYADSFPATKEADPDTKAADMAFWGRAGRFTIYEFAALANGIEPDRYSDEVDRVRQLARLLARDFDSSAKVDVATLLRWCDDKKVSIAAELSNALEAYSGPDNAKSSEAPIQPPDRPKVDDKPLHPKSAISAARILRGLLKIKYRKSFSEVSAQALADHLLNEGVKVDPEVVGKWLKAARMVGDGPGSAEEPLDF